MKKYKPHNFYNCISAYVEPEGEWDKCPKCSLTPKIWVFNNGRSTACGCWETTYDGFHVYAESIMSVHKRTGGTHMDHHDSDGLRKNWNHYCKTEELLFIRHVNRW